MDLIVSVPDRCLSFYSIIYCLSTNNSDTNLISFYDFFNVQYCTLHMPVQIKL